MLINVRPKRVQMLYYTGKGRKLADADPSAKLALFSHFIHSYIFHPYLQCFCWRDSPKTWPHNHGFLWSHLTIILDTKSTALTGTGCQIKPFNDKFSPKVSWEISSGLHCGKKALNLTLNLSRLSFFLPSDPESLAIFYRFISFIKKHREFPNWSSDSGHWLESSTNETSFHHQIFCKSNIKRGRT